MTDHDQRNTQSPSGGMLRRWWEQWPDRLEFELGELERAGISYEISEDALKRGVVIVRLRAEIDGELLNLIATFPDFYPYLRVEVSAPDLDLGRHQHPVSKNLCLIGRSTRNWRSSDTLARLITDRVPQVLHAARSADPFEVEALEEHQGEPHSDYYQYRPDTVVLVDGGWTLPPAAKGGECEIGIRRREEAIRGAILTMSASDGTRVATTDPGLAQVFPHHLTGRWVKLDEPIRSFAPLEFLQVLLELCPHLKEERWQRIDDGHIDIVIIAFPEEILWRTMGTGWVVMVRSRSKGQQKKRSVYLARSGRAGLEDMLTRTPELAPLRTKRLATFGLGALGAPSAIEFARAGLGELRLLDHDFVDAPTIVRWPLGIAAAGLMKTEALQQFLEWNYPYTRVKIFTRRLGEAHEDADSDQRLLAKMLRDADLIYDATAELGIQHLLSDLAGVHGIPYVAVSATYGAWGGIVARIRPGRTEGCWHCLQHALNDGTITAPPQDPRGELQPAGCADPTFTGANFDLAEIATAGVRLAVATLCAESPAAYGDFDWDVATVALRDHTGAPVPPVWRSFKLIRHPACQACSGSQTRVG